MTNMDYARKTQVQRPGPKIARGNREPATGKEETPKMPPEDSQQRQAEYEAAEAELEAAKRQAAERRAAQKAMVDPDPEDSEKSDSEGSEDSTAEKVTGEDFAKWKAQEEQREKREVQLKTWPRVSELPPVPTVTDPCLDILKDDKWVERHTLSSSRQRWTLGRAVGEVDFVMNHPSISRQHASLSRGSAGIYLTDLNSGHGIFVEGQRIEKNVRVLLKNGVGIRFGTSTRLYYYHEPEG
eukprot:symbB.v1.2.013559.t1/scaffold952.1/size217748/17